ncbi:MAG TPA: polyprenyl synthetase family protein [Thermoanaerobaculia bacterium]|nr:polyprenyl synthetase family protein [Thermoanaerobaculia bacterium]
MSLEAFLALAKAETEAALARVLPPPGDPLADAMRYSTLAGGKRLRPALALAFHDVLGGSGAPRGEVAEAAAALELVHTYSLVHDDLPCMDDDALRRGKPTCHVVHGEAMALLAGDALQSLGFEVLASRPRGEAFSPRRADAVLLLARAIGAGGMAGGQALDLAASGSGHGELRTEARLREIHEKKTGRLLSAACELGAVLAGASEERRRAAADYGDALGVLFQIADDLLDVTASAAVLGKTVGKDEAQEKLTYVSVFGIEGAVAERERALAATLERARLLEGDPGLLAELAGYAAHRDR